MSCIIIGSPSTGSSLLRRLLNRHTHIFCGSETSLFAKSCLYDDWNRNKSKLLRPARLSLVNDGWHHMRGVSIEEDYNWSNTDLKDLVKKQRSFKEFVEHFFSHTLEKSGKKYWIEKTPSNAFVAEHFLSSFETGKIIHIVRHPLDVIASLVNRGMKPFDAVCTYLSNTSSALKVKDMSNTIVVRYEDLVSHPEKTMESLLGFLGFALEDHLFQGDPDREKGNTHMEGWKYKETEAVGKGSVGRFFEMEKGLQNLLLGFINEIKCSLNSDISSVSDCAAVLDYEMPAELTQLGGVSALGKVIQKDKWNRLFKRAYFTSSNYPIYVS